MVFFLAFSCLMCCAYYTGFFFFSGAYWAELLYHTYLLLTGYLLVCVGF